MLFSAMAATPSHLTSPKISILGHSRARIQLRRRRSLSVSAQQEPQSQETREADPPEELPELKRETGKAQGMTEPRPVEVQANVKSKNMVREFGGQWLSSTTRHVRIFAAYIDPVTSDFDQTQTDKLTLILDPTNEFVWSPESCHKVYSYFQELVDHYEGADLTEYTLRLIGSDIEHYIRKMLYAQEIKYNMDANVLNFSMGKPRILNMNELEPQDTNDQP